MRQSPQKAYISDHRFTIIAIRAEKGNLPSPPAAERGPAGAEMRENGRGRLELRPGADMKSKYTGNCWCIGIFGDRHNLK
jgi:hypothetical protein